MVTCVFPFRLPSQSGSISYHSLLPGSGEDSPILRKQDAASGRKFPCETHSELRIDKGKERKLVETLESPRKRLRFRGEARRHLGEGDVRESLWRAGCPEWMLGVFLWQGRQT